MPEKDPKAPYKGLPAFPARHFGWKEVRCHHCLQIEEPGFPEQYILEGEPFKMLCKLLDAVRGELGKPVIVNSWYRCPEHPIEAKKRTPGVHAHGLAADLRLSGIDVALAVHAVMRSLQHLRAQMDVAGFGFQQKGSWESLYLHVDVGGHLPEFRQYRGTTWTY